MEAGFSKTARRLWSTAPYWRLTVMGGGVFAGLSVLYAFTGPGSSGSFSSGGSAGSTYTAAAPAPPPVDPAVEADLAAYKDAVHSANSISGDGARCEAIAAAYNSLSSSDIAAGHDILSSTKAQLKAIHDGENCKTLLAASDARFQVLSNAVSTASGDASLANFQAAIKASGALNTFDLSRALSPQQNALIQSSKNYAVEISASDQRMAAFEIQAEAFNADETPQAYLQLASSFENLTALDRDRLRNSSPADFLIAEKAVATIQTANNSLDSLPALVRQSQASQDPDAEEQLVDAVASINSLSLAIATPDQKNNYDAAKEQAVSNGWSLLSQRAANFNRNPTPDTAEVLAALYKVLTIFPSGQLTATQQNLLDQGKAATAELSASDSRITAMLAAASDWTSQGPGGGNSVLAARQVITPFDEARFDATDRAAWETLGRAQAIIQGPSLGLNKATMNQVTLYVQPSDGSTTETEIANTIADRLSDAGFHVVQSPGDAAVIVKAVIVSQTEPIQNLSSGYLEMTSSATLALTAIWAIDNSILLATTVDGVGQANVGGGDPKTEALIDAVRGIASKFSDMTSK